MALQIIKPGIMDCLHDGGRFGHADAGINPGGVMDPYAATAANYLVGNAKDEGVLELHFPASQILFTEPALIAICGADLSAAILDEPVPCWQPVMVKRNAVLHFQKWKWGLRAYLAVHGGFKAEKWLNSYSTHLKAGVGGHEGRTLRKDDLLQIHDNKISKCAIEQYVQPGRYSRVLNWGIHAQDVYNDISNLLVLPGPEWELLNAGSKEIFANRSFAVSKRSDRMGCLLNGISMHLNEPMEMVSTGVDHGTIQLLPDGQLMILAADHQTTGGYPRIGNVISAHLPKLAQLTVGSEVHFNLTDIVTAEQLLFSQLRDLRIIERACRERINQFYAQH